LVKGASRPANAGEMLLINVCRNISRWSLDSHGPLPHEARRGAGAVCGCLSRAEPETWVARLRVAFSSGVM
jgi:hypothetical protein